jgi:GNAT superfamily N-acetyltransferase
MSSGSTVPQGQDKSVEFDRGSAGDDRLEGLEVRQVGMDVLPTIQDLNLEIFEEERVINSFERDDLLILVAYLANEPIGFKIGYRENRYTFYSAKGGVLAPHRRSGVARALLNEMCEVARDWGYSRLAYDTFPNRHPGMTIMGLLEGFRVTDAGFNRAYRDFRVRLEKAL